MFDALWEKHTHVEVTCHSFKMLALASEFEYFLIQTGSQSPGVHCLCRLTSSSVGGCFVRLIRSRCWQTDLRRQSFPSVSRVSSPLKWEKSSTSFTQKKHGMHFWEIRPLWCCCFPQMCCFLDELSREGVSTGVSDVSSDQHVTINDWKSSSARRSHC